jgi:hypothetical protein
MAASLAISFGVETSAPNTCDETGRQAPCDIGAIDEAIEVNGEASHSPQASMLAERTRTSSAS